MTYAWRFPDPGCYKEAHWYGGGFAFNVRDTKNRVLISADNSVNI